MFSKSRVLLALLPADERLLTLAMPRVRRRPGDARSSQEWLLYFQGRAAGAGLWRGLIYSMDSTVPESLRYPPEIIPPIQPRMRFSERLTKKPPPIWMALKMMRSS